jgi:hypothetical protein
MNKGDRVIAYHPSRLNSVPLLGFTSPLHRVSQSWQDRDHVAVAASAVPIHITTFPPVSVALTTNRLFPSPALSVPLVARVSKYV